jgi:hypothetical protein
VLAASIIRAMTMEAAITSENQESTTQNAIKLLLKNSLVSY